MPKNKLFFRLFFNSLLGIVLILIWSRFIDLRQLGQLLSRTDLKFAVLFPILFLSASVFRATRLKILLQQPILSWPKLIFLTFLSQFLSFIIPVRAGEFTKGIYLGLTLNLPLSRTLVWVFVDRFVDLWLYLGLITLLLPFIPTNMPANFLPGVIGLLLFMTTVTIFGIIWANLLKQGLELISRLLVWPFLQKIFVSLTHNIVEGLIILRRRSKDLAVIGFLTVLAGVCDGLVWVCAFAALGVNLDFFTSLLATSLEAFTFLLPAAPGYIGSAEATGLAVFSGIFGFDANLASAAVVFFHLMAALTLLLVGLVSLHFLKFNLGLVWRKLRGSNN